MNAKSELVELSRVRVSVYHWLILDVHGLTSVFKSVETLLVIGLCRTDTGYHICV